MDIKKINTGLLNVNTYIATDNGEALIVDPGGFNQDIVDYIDENNLILKYILLTHAHADHIGGVFEFKQLYNNAKIVGGYFEKEIFSSPRFNLSNEIYGKSISITCDTLVKDGDILKLGTKDLKIIETPGHTIGGISIYTPPYVFCGDTIFRESIGRTDLYSGDFNQLIASIKNKIFTLPDDTILLPGHMSYTDVGHEKRFNQFV